MKIILAFTLLVSLFFTGCITAKDIYDFNYNNDEMTGSMMDNYGDPFQKPF